MSSGPKKQTIGYWYRLLYHFGFSKGPIDAFLEFRGGDRTAWSGELTSSGRIHIDKPKLFGGEKSEGGLVGDFDVMFGESNQQANDYLTANLGPEQPTYRGKATGVWRGGRYGAMNPYPKPASFKIRRILKGWDNDAPWYPGRAEIIMSPGAVNEADFGPTSSGWRYRVVPLADTADYSSASYDDSSWSTGQAPFASAAGHPYSEDTGFPAISNTSWPLNTKIWIRRTFNVGAVGTVSLIVFVDNYATVWVNGHLVLPRTGTISSPSGPIFTHVIDIPANFLIAGNNVIAVLGEDFGTYSYLSIKINATGNSYLVGMNPAHILYDSITAQDMAGEPVGLINDASFRAAADTLFSEGFGLCTSYEFDTSIEDFQQRICDIIGACLTQSRVDGQYYLDLIRGNYVLADLPILGEDDVIEFSRTPTSITEVTNSITVEWFDPEAKEDRSTAPIQTLGAIMAAGGVIHETKTYREIPTEDLAIRVGQRDLQAVATPINRFTLATNRRLFALRPGQAFRLQMPSEGIADMVCVVGDFEDGGRLRINAVQDVFGFPSTVYIKPESGLALPSDSVPIASAHQVLIEAPYVELVTSLSRADLNAFPGDAGAIMVAATRPTTGRNYSLWTAATGESFDQYGLGDWCPSALVVEAAPRATAPFSCTMSGGTDLTNVTVGTWALWDSEIVRVDALDPTAMTLTIARGCADTVPVLHAAGSRIYFCGDWGISDAREYVDGETVQAKLLTRTGTDEMSLDAATALSVVMHRRHYRPYPPAAVTVNGAINPGDQAGQLTVAWHWRDRLLQDDRLFDQTQGDVGPEAGTTATIRFFRGATLLQTMSGLSTSPASYTPPEVGGAFRIEVETVRGGLTSSQMWVTSFTYGVPPPIEYSAKVLSFGPACYFRLNEQSGLVITDSSPNGKNGVYGVDASTLTTSGLLVRAVDSDRAVLLPGILKQLTISTPPMALNNPWTWGCVMRPDAQPSQESIGCIVQLGSAGDGCPEIDVVHVAAGQFKIRVMRSGQTELFRSASTWAYGTVLRIWLRHSSTGLTLTVNGAVEGTNAGVFSNFTGTVRIGFASFAAVGYPFNGVLDEMVFFASRLTDANLTELNNLAAGV